MFRTKKSIVDGLPIIGEFDCFLDEQLETIADGNIDIGPVLVQNLGLEINPFPKKEGIRLASVYKQDDLTIEDEEKPNSFKLFEISFSGSVGVIASSENEVSFSLVVFSIIFSTSWFFNNSS